MVLLYSESFLCFMVFTNVFVAVNYIFFGQGGLLLQLSIMNDGLLC